MTALRELADARDILDAFLIENDGEETPEISALWEQLEGETTEKIERWALWILDKAGDGKKLKDEEQRIAAKRKAIENAIERSKAELMHQLNRLGKTKVNGLLATIAIQSNSVPSVTCALDSDALGQSESCVAFVVEVPATWRLDRDAVLAAFKAGDKLPAEITVEKGSHLRIR